MAERPKFRRKRRAQVDDPSEVLPPRVPDGEDRPIAPMDSREQRLARRAAEARRNAEQEADTKAEEQRLAREAVRRGVEARAEAKRRAEGEAQAQADTQRIAAERLRARKAAAAKDEAELREQPAQEARAAAKRNAATQAKARRNAEADAPERSKAVRATEERARQQAEAKEQRIAAARGAAKARAQARLQAEDAARQKSELAAGTVAEAEEKARADARAIQERVARDAAEARAAAEAQAEAKAKSAERAEAEERSKANAIAAAAKADQSALVQDPPRETAAPLALQDPVPAAAKSTRAPTRAENWAQLEEFTLAPLILERNRIITAERSNPAHATFDVLRTRLLQGLAERGWSRVAITSPTKGCGKTFTAANLAISLARQENCGTLLLDLDMRAPNLHKMFGLNPQGSIGDMLRGKVSPLAHMMRPGPNDIHVGRNIAFGFNSQVEDYAAELLQDPTTARTLQDMQRQLQPDVVLYDMPPALSSDDVIASRAHFDAVLLVIGGGLTTESEVKEVERRLGEHTPLLGMVLNKAEGVSAKTYAY